LSYGRGKKPEYQEPPSSSGSAGKPRFKPKDRDKEIVEESAEKVVKDE